MDQVSGMDFHSENRHGKLEVFEMREAVGHADAAREHVKTGGADFIEVAHRTVGQHTAAAQGKMTAGGYFAPIGADGDTAEAMVSADIGSGERLRLRAILRARDTAFFRR